MQSDGGARCRLEKRARTLALLHPAMRLGEEAMVGTSMDCRLPPLKGRVRSQRLIGHLRADAVVVGAPAAPNLATGHLDHHGVDANRVAGHARDVRLDAG